MHFSAVLIHISGRYTIPLVFNYRYIDKQSLRRDMWTGDEEKYHEVGEGKEAGETARVEG